MDPLSARLEAHPLFEPWTDPESGVVSWILRPPRDGDPTRLGVADSSPPVLRQTWYFVTPNLHLDAKRLWYTCCHPPSAMKYVGVVNLDPEDPWIREFPAAAVETADPLMDPDGRGVVVGVGPALWHLEETGAMAEVARLPEALLLTGQPGVADKPGRHPVHRLACHLTRRAPTPPPGAGGVGRPGPFLLDATVGEEILLLDLDPEAQGASKGGPESPGTGTMGAAGGTDGTGAVRIWRRFPATGAPRHTHAAASPVDPDLALIAQDWGRDPTTGAIIPFRERIWIHDRRDDGLTYLTPGLVSEYPRITAHEWWTADGRVAWCHYTDGVFRKDPRRREDPPEHIWRRSACHAHCDAAGAWWVCDDSPYRWAKEPCKVLAYHRPSGREIPIASALPEPPVARPRFHLDPHPQVSAGGEVVVYTTTARGRGEVALCPLAPLGAR